MDYGWKRIACSVTLSVLAAFTAASTAAAADLKHIEVSVAQANDINGLAWRVAQERKFFEAHGIVVDKIIPAVGGGTTLQNIIAGNLPFGQVATAALVTAHKKGAPIKIIAGATQVPWEIGWGVLKDSPVKDIKDLEGKTWGFTNAGSVTEAMSYLVPKYAGLDLSKIKRVATGGVGAGIALMESGAVDVTFIPPLVEVEKAASLGAVFHADKYVPHYELTMIVSSRNYAEKNPAVARGLLAALQQAIDWIKANPDDAGKIYAAGVKVDPAVATKIVKRFIEIDVWGLGFNADALNAVAEGLKYTDKIESVDWTDILTDAYLPDDKKGGIPGAK